MSADDRSSKDVKRASSGGARDSTKRNAASGGKRSRTTSSRSGRSSGAAATVGQGDAPDPAQPDLLSDSRLYYRIGEVAKITGVKPHVLRYWETEFRWMAPPKSRSRQRLYRRKDIEMILVIKQLLYEERYTIAGARQRIKDIGLSRAGARAAATDAGADSSRGSQPARTGAGEGAPAGTEAPREALRASYRRIREELDEIRSLL